MPGTAASTRSVDAAAGCFEDDVVGAIDTAASLSARAVLAVALTHAANDPACAQSTTNRLIALGRRGWRPSACTLMTP
ncbi:MAG: hypothetical protein ABSG43_21070 [Solirubrobacteraceae bacterium]|jgi:hypothetical protein